VNIENGLHSIDRTNSTRENQKSQRIGMDLQNVLSLLNNNSHSRTFIDSFFGIKCFLPHQCFS
jgi:hypothetical protein